MQEVLGLIEFMLPTNWYSFDELVLVFQETNVKDSVQVNKPTDQETLSEQADNSHLWTEELKKEVQNLEAQSEKHAAKQDSHDGNQNDVHTTNKQETTATENVNDVTQSDYEKTKDENNQEFLHVHSSNEHIKEENLKTAEQLGLTETSEQKTETQSKNYQAEDSTHQETKDDVSGSKASQHLEDSEVGTETKSQQRSKKKTKLKKVRGKRKTIEHEQMDEWTDDDYYGDDDDDEPYDEDMDEDLDGDEPLEGSEDFDGFVTRKDYSEEETDSIDSWQMTEKPLDESEDLNDEEDDLKIKEQEVLQEEIKQLKGEYATYQLASVHKEIVALLISFHSLFYSKDVQILTRKIAY